MRAEERACARISSTPSLTSIRPGLGWRSDSRGIRGTTEQASQQTAHQPVAIQRTSPQPALDTPLKDRHQHDGSCFVSEDAVDSGNPVEATMRTIRLQSHITYPECGYVKEETMPTDACLWFYECESCRPCLGQGLETAACSVPMARLNVHRRRLRPTRPVYADMPHLFGHRPFFHVVGWAGTCRSTKHGHLGHSDLRDANALDH
jgi:hypothetical protein